MIQLFIAIKCFVRHQLPELGKAISLATNEIKTLSRRVILLPLLFTQSNELLAKPALTRNQLFLLARKKLDLAAAS